MSRVIVQSTQIAVSLSLNIQVQNENDTHLMTLRLVPLTTLFFALWSIRQSWSRFWFELAMMIDDIIGRLSIAGKVVSIGFNSLVWGMGL